MSLKTYTVSSSQCPFFYAILERLCFIVITKERIDLSNEFIEADVTYIIKGYNRSQFIKDVTAGIIVAIIALPLSIALALASGVGP